MLHQRSALAALLFFSLIWTITAYRNFSSDLIPPIFSLDKDRPDNCPPCFDCNSKKFECKQFGTCHKSDGRCACPPGFGREDCSEPTCGSLGQGRSRDVRGDGDCQCDEGWGGINCNVCEEDRACNALMPENSGGVCFKEQRLVKENHQICDVKNRKIIDQLKDRKPQITFSCNAEDETCNFQFWIGRDESFYCGLDTCKYETKNAYDRNSTKYTCEHIQCACIPDRMLCGEAGSVDIGEFLAQEIKGPAFLSTISTEGGSGSDGTIFSEPQMNDLIKTVFGDEHITLDCDPGECLYQTDVPGYTRPVKEINTPLIAGVIAGCALFVVLVILFVWFLSRRNFKYGPIHLSDDSDDDLAQMMAEHKPASLQFENVSYDLNGKSILSGVQGIALPGQLMAIMGASGAGKTTFLDLLARKNKRGVAQGNFYINGEKIPDDEYRSVIGFVDQDDTLLPTLTVHETIMTSALLRLPRDMNISIKEQRVYEVEKQLGILAIKDSLIGSEDGRGISGGEKRRVGIACELVTSPSILFLDEPTSGLDAFNAFNVVECLVTLAKSYNRTVIFTIHQPRSNIVALFDHLILLAKGRTVYSGPSSSCQSYFDGIGYSCPPGFNIADYLVDLTMHAATASTPIDEGGPAGFDGSHDGMRTQNSSIRAVKSIASTSRMSMQDNSSFGSNEPILRPKSNRKQSLKQQQDRKLYTRNKSTSADEPQTPKTEDEASDHPDGRRNSQDLIKMSKQHGHIPPQILDDPDHLPPPAHGAKTGLDDLVSNYAASDIGAAVRDDITAAVASASNANGSANGETSSAVVTGTMKGYRRISYLSQFMILSQRTWRNLYRNPMLMLTHYAIAILLAVLSGFLFYGLTDDIKGFQNRLGLFFFVLALFGFSTLTTLTVFSSERLIFVRERANGYYSPITYFAAKVVFDIVPLRLIPPIIMGAIVYPMSGLTPAWGGFFKFILILVLFNLAAAAICLFIGIIFKDAGVANLIGSLVMLFSLLFAGLLLNHDAIPKAALWLQSVSLDPQSSLRSSANGTQLSIFHYGFEALIVNEVKYLTLVDHKYGLDIEVPGASILSAFGFDNSGLWPDVIGLGVFAAVFILIAYTAMHFVLVEKR